MYDTSKKETFREQLEEEICNLRAELSAERIEREQAISDLQCGCFIIELILSELLFPKLPVFFIFPSYGGTPG